MIVFFWKYGFFRDMDFWICGNCSQTYYKISIFKFRNLVNHKTYRNVQHLAIPALSVGCSLPSGNPKSGFWLFVSMDSPLFEVIQLTEYPGNSLMDSSENWKTSEMSVMETHLLCFGCTPGVNFLEIRSAGSPLTEVNQLTEFPGNASMDSK